MNQGIKRLAIFLGVAGAITGFILGLGEMISNTKKQEGPKLIGTFGENNQPSSYTDTDIARFDALRGKNIITTEELFGPPPPSTLFPELYNQKVNVSLIRPPWLKCVIFTIFGFLIPFITVNGIYWVVMGFAQSKTRR